MFRDMPQGRTLTPGYTVIYPNREKPASVTTKGVVVLLMLVSVALMLIVTFGGWSKLQGLKPVNFILCLAYLIIAYYIWARWARGLLPIVAALSILVLTMSAIAGSGLAGTSWFDRSQAGFGAAHSIFGGTGLGPDALGLVTVLLIPVEVLLIVVAMIGFSQGWNVELEVPKDEAERRRRRPGAPPAQPAAA
jgi:hypothetical protein